MPKTVPVSLFVSILVSGCIVNTELSGSASADSYSIEIHDTTGDSYEMPLDSDIIDAIDDDHEDATDVPELPYTPQCGNGTIDEGEECDDGNRLDGDGCTWMCTIGDGDPPPTSDPTVPHYAPVEEPDPVEVPSAGGSAWERLPLCWTGSEYGTVYWERDEETSGRFRFIRFNSTGVLIDAAWAYEVSSPFAGADLIWHGDGYALLYSDTDSGLYLQKLDDVGKPVLGPVLFEDDIRARAPAADITTDGYVVSWVVEGCPGIIRSWCSFDGYVDQIYVRIIDGNGATEGLPGPMLVEDSANGPPDITAGDDGYGIAVWSDPLRDGSCSARIIKVNSELSDAVYSGFLSSGRGGDIIWAESMYFTSWAHLSGCTSEGCSTTEICVARFTPGGVLDRAPVCNDVDSRGSLYPPRLDYGDLGLGITAADSEGLWFLRADMRGVAVEAPVEILSDYVGPYGFIWSGTEFALVYILHSGSMRLQRFVPA